MVRNAACEVLGREDVGAEEPLMSGVLEHSVQANGTLRPIPALCLSPGSTTEIHQNTVSKEAAQTLHTIFCFAFAPTSSVFTHSPTTIFGRTA